MKSKWFVKYAKKNLVLIKMIKMQFKIYRKVRDHFYYTAEFTLLIVFAI